ncbi:MAG: polysaccharide biosynthesis/export family protein [Deltaproteobacteria bacterium]|nr:polysaccharide biosynthesis/export family protein [Deltaproteobacteria bacterium]
MKPTGLYGLRQVLSSCMAWPVCVGLLMGAGGCATERPFVWVRDVPAAALAPAADPIIHPRDSILVHVQDQIPLSGEYAVREDGAYVHPTLGNISVEGKTPAQVAEFLQIRLTNVIVNPRVTVSISRRAPARVNVVGEVKTPGSYELTRDRSVTAALAAAGWLTVFADDDRIFVVRPGDRETRIRFKARELTAPDPQSASFRLRDGDVVVVE